MLITANVSPKNQSRNHNITCTNPSMLGLYSYVMHRLRLGSCLCLLRRDTEAEYCDERVCLSLSLCLWHCLCVCLSAMISAELHVRSAPQFSRVLRTTVARFSSGSVVIRYAFPVLWMTSYLIISQGCPTSAPWWSAVHTQPWAWLQTVRSNTSYRPTDARDYFLGA